MRKARASLALGPSGAHGSPVGAAASEMSRHTASVASRHTAPPSPRFDLAPSGPETEKYQLLCHSCVPTAPDRMRVIEVARADEHGLDGSYIESWKFLTDGQGRFLVVRVGHSGRLLQTLVVIDFEIRPSHVQAAVARSEQGGSKSES